MRERAAALPDQTSVVPAQQNILVVKSRGPVNVRSTPDKKGQVIATVAKDATVKELERSGKWVRVETETGTGWVSASLLRQSGKSR